MPFSPKYARLILPLLLLVTPLIAAERDAGAPIRIHGTVAVRSKLHATIFLVRKGDGDGVAEHLFQVWSNPGLPLNATYRGAAVEFTGTSLVVIVPASQMVYSFTVADEKPPAIPVPEGFSATGYEVLGLQHKTSVAAEKYPIETGSHSSGRISANDCGSSCDYLPFEDPWGASAGTGGCTSGGPYATSCSQTQGGNSCSVTCSGHSYACCVASNPPSCSCKF